MSRQLAAPMVSDRRKNGSRTAFYFSCTAFYIETNPLHSNARGLKLSHGVSESFCEFGFPVTLSIKYFCGLMIEADGCCQGYLIGSGGLGLASE